MNIKVDFDNIVVKEDKNDFNVKVLMLKGEKGDKGDGEQNVIDKIQVNGSDLPVTNKTVNVPVPVVDSALSSSSTNPVQNNTIYNALNNKVDTSELNNYYEISEIDGLLDDKANVSIVNKKPYVFDSVAEMKAYDLQKGDYVITKGYYAVGDGGRAEYQITDIQSSDEYQEELNNNLYANLIIKGGVFIPEQFGAKGDGSTDCSIIFNLIFNKMNNNNKLLLTQTYLIDNNLYLSNKNNIVISGGTLKAGENLTGYMLNSNQTAVINYAGWNKKTENLTIENLFIDGSYTANGIYLDNYLRVKIISCTLHNFKDYGIYLNSGNEAEIIGTNLIGRTNGDQGVDNTGILINSNDNIISSCVIAYCKWAIDILKQNNQINNSHFYCNLQNGGNIKITKAGFCSLTNNYFDGSGIYAINPYNITIDNNIVLISDATQHVFKFSKDITYISVKGIYITNTLVNDTRTDKTNNYDLISCDFNPNEIENCVIDNITAVATVNINNPYNIFSFKNDNIPVIVPDTFFRATNNNHTIGTHSSTENFYTYTYNGNYINSVYTGPTSSYPWLFFKLYVPEKMLVKKEMISNTTVDIAFFDENETYIGNNRVTLDKGTYYVGIYRTHTILLSTK